MRRRWLAVRTSTGSTGSRSRVRWSIRALRCLRSLARLDLGVADRAGRRPLAPSGRDRRRPTGRCRGRTLAPAVSSSLALSRGVATSICSPAALVMRSLLGGQVFLPGPDDVLGQLQGVDARCDGFDAGPEQPGQACGRWRRCWRSPATAGVPAGSRRAGREWVGTACGYRSTSSSIVSRPLACPKARMCAARRRGRCRSRAAAGRSRPSSARRGRGPAAGCRPVRHSRRR